MSGKKLLKNATIINEGKQLIADILIDGEIISKIGNDLSEPGNVEIIDLKTIDQYFVERIENGVNKFSIDQIPEIAKDLKADAVFIYCVRTASAKSQAAELAKAFAIVLMTGVVSVETTTEVKIINQIYDGKTGDLIWQFNHWNKGMYFSTPMLITNPIIREVKNRVPYRLN